MWFKCAEKRKLALEPTVFKPRIFLCLTDDILDSGMVTASQKVGEKVDHNKPFFLSLKYKEIIFVIVHFSTATSFAIAVLQGYKGLFPDLLSIAEIVCIKNEMEMFVKLTFDLKLLI